MPVSKLGQQISVPTVGTVKIGQKAPEVSLTGAKVLRKDATATSYDLNGDGFADVKVDLRTGANGKVSERITTYERNAAGVATKSGSFGFDTSTGIVNRLVETHGGKTAMYIDSNRDGKTDYESKDVSIDKNTTRNTTRELDANGNPKVTSTMTTVGSTLPAGSTSFATKLQLPVLGEVAMGQDAASLELTRGTLVSKNGQVATYDRFGDGKTLVSITDVVDGDAKLLEQQVSITQGDTTSGLFIDGKTNKIFQLSNDTPELTSYLIDGNKDGKTDDEIDATFNADGNMRWFDVSDTNGDGAPDHLDTSVDSNVP
jgi:hypothetical protein